MIKAPKKLTALILKDVYSVDLDEIQVILVDSLIKNKRSLEKLTSTLMYSSQGYSKIWGKVSNLVGSDNSLSLFDQVIIESDKFTLSIPQNLDDYYDEGRVINVSLYESYAGLGTKLYISHPELPRTGKKYYVSIENLNLIELITGGYIREGGVLTGLYTFTSDETFVKSSVEEVKQSLKIGEELLNSKTNKFTLGHCYLTAQDRHILIYLGDLSIKTFRPSYRTKGVWDVSYYCCDILHTSSGQDIRYPMFIEIINSNIVEEIRGLINQGVKMSVTEFLYWAIEKHSLNPYCRSLKDVSKTKVFGIDLGELVYDQPADELNKSFSDLIIRLGGTAEYIRLLDLNDSRAKKIIEDVVSGIILREAPSLYSQVFGSKTPPSNLTNADDIFDTLIKYDSNNRYNYYYDRFKYILDRLFYGGELFTEEEIKEVIKKSL